MNTKESRTNVVRYFFAAMLVSIFLIVAAFHSAKSHHSQTTAAQPHEFSKQASAKSNLDWTAVYGKLPLAFEKNQGQAEGAVRYISHGRGYGLFLTTHEAVLTLRSSTPRESSSLLRAVSFRDSRSRRQIEKTSVIRMHFEGANSTPQIEGSDRLPGRVDYFVGNDPKNWHTDIPSYARVKYTGVYPGVDLIFYGNQNRLEYDFVVAPGSDPSVIKMNLEGANKLRINSRGDLLLSVSGGEVVLQKPVVYQQLNGRRHEIDGKYLIAGNHRVGFAVANYDRSEPLILDPVLNYSTYLGGTLGDFGNGIAVDTTGNAFVVGTTKSIDFPTTANAFNKGPLITNPNAVFVTELNPAGTQQIYSTYLAGSGGDSGLGITVDSSGKIYVTGQTFSINYPTTPNALKAGPLASNASGTSFISKIDPALSGTASLVYSSYLGGTTVATQGDLGSAIAADTAGNAYITGITFSAPGTGLTQFPVTSGAYQSTLNSASGNAFLTRIDTTKSGTASLIYSTYLGGAGAATLGFSDWGFGVAVDSTSAAYLTGVTSSTNFPTTTANAFAATAPPAAATGTAFVSKIDTSGGRTGTASLLYSTYLGGDNYDFGLALALGPSNVAYVTGTTGSLSFPTIPAGAYQKIGSTSGAAFISLVDTGLIGSASLKYSTFLGSGGTTGSGIRADTAGKAYVAGGTQSGTFPVTRAAFQIAKASAGAAAGDGFISQLNPGGNGIADLVYSTYFGGSGSVAGFDTANAIAIDSANNAYITGTTYSTDLPVFPTGAFQTILKGTNDAFAAKLTLIPVVALDKTNLAFGGQFLTTTSAAQTVTLTNNGNAALTIAIAITGDYAQTNTCGASVAAGASCTISVTFTPTVLGARPGTLTITDNANSSPRVIALTGSGWDFNVSAPATLSVNQGASGSVTVTVTPAGGFNSAVSLACSGAPALATCTISPASVTPADGVTPVTATLSVTTTGLVPPRSLRPPLTSVRQVVPLLVAFVMLLSMLYARRLRTRLGMVAVSLIFIVLAGCGGSTHDKTPKGTSTLTITATSGSRTKTTTVALTVN
ncbi:MAG TPA: SBBP repeat-containing protein [Candidatus Dormibacteraeota bacterium]|nr:SBBP repeat-containing protein [Candidatus Dormibacteraeota bacterium]